MPAEDEVSADTGTGAAASSAVPGPVDAAASGSEGPLAPDARNHNPLPAPNEPAAEDGGDADAMDLS